MSNKKVDETAVEKIVEEQVAKEVASVPTPVVNIPKVLETFRVEETADDVLIFERFIVPAEAEGEKGVKVHLQGNSKVFYIEKLAKKFSQNVVTEESEA